MNKNHITRLLILLIALHISSCTADDSSIASNSSKPDMLKQELDKNDASLLGHYLQQHYPQGSNIKPLITDLKHIGAKVEKKIVTTSDLEKRRAELYFTPDLPSINQLQQAQFPSCGGVPVRAGWSNQLVA